MVIEAILIGVLSTAIMDFGALALSRVGILRKPSFCLLGRWIFELSNGRWVQRGSDIISSRQRRFETLLGTIAHYAIGAILALAFVFLLQHFQASSVNFWMAIGFGILTSAFPWLIMFPSMGFGFFAKNAPPQAKIFATSFIGHLNFGLGLWIGCMIFWK